MLSSKFFDTQNIGVNTKKFKQKDLTVHKCIQTVKTLIKLHSRNDLGLFARPICAKTSF